MPQFGGGGSRDKLVKCYTLSALRRIRFEKKKKRRRFEELMYNVVHGQADSLLLSHQGNPYG